jgi:porin
MNRSAPFRAVLAFALAFLLALLWTVSSSAALEAQESDSETDEGAEAHKAAESSVGGGQFGGPDQVDVLIARDGERTSRIVREPLLQSYFVGKQRLQENRGLSLGLDYSAAYLSASDSLEGTEDDAGSGMVRFFGSWDLVGRSTPDAGALVWKVEHRHPYTDTPVKGLGFDLGYVGLFLPPFSDDQLRMTNLYWRQRFRGARTTLFAGYLDATDYVDIYLLASPWTGFMNFAFSTGNLTMAVPNDAAFGLAVGSMLSEKFFGIAGLVDRNGDPTDPFHSAESFFSDNEYFKSIELGWTPSQAEIYSHQAHLTFWHADEREETDEAEGWGLNFSYVNTFGGGKWMPFLRAGYAEEGGSLMQKSVSAGFSYAAVPNSDKLGFGVNWGEVNEDTWGSGLDDQLTLELFYYWQLTKVYALTPDVQYLVDPALNPDQDSLWVYGVRLRAAF